MRKISKEVKIGIAFIVAIFVLYFGISFLSGVNIFKPTNAYVVVFDNVSGLTKSTPVTINGLQVGNIHSLALDMNNPNQVIAVLHLHKEMKLPKGTEIELENQLLGGATVILKMGSISDELYTAFDTLYGVRQEGMLDAAGTLVPQFANLLPKIDSILTGIQLLVNDPSLQQSLNNVSKTTAELNVIIAGLNKDIPQITKNLNTTTNNLASVSGKLDEIDINSTYQSIDSTMKNIQYLSARLTSKDSSVGLLLNDREMYDSLNTTINNASLLLKDIKENPQRYINVKVF